MADWPYNTSQWQGLRSAKLSDQPLCEACLRLEIVMPAYAVDHITAIAAGGDPFPPLDRLMSLCEACHNHKTNAKDHPQAHGFRRALRGYDAEGNPIDPEGWETHTEGHTAPLNAGGNQVPDETYMPPRAPAGDPMAYPDTPGGLQGRETVANRPAWYSREDLVLRTVRNKESDLWA